MSTSEHEATEHLRKAREHLHLAARTWADQLVAPAVRSNLRDAARSVLQAGIAALDADERRRHPPTEQPPAQPN